MEALDALASELAEAGGITPQTASGHLARLVEAGLLGVRKQGRHRYFSLSGADVANALQRLSHRDQEVLQLHLWEGLEPREIADVLGVTAALIRPRLSRARSRLRELLGNDPPPAGHLPGEPVPTSPKEELR